MRLVESAVFLAIGTAGLAAAMLDGILACVSGNLGLPALAATVALSCLLVVPVGLVVGLFCSLSLAFWGALQTRVRPKKYINRVLFGAGAVLLLGVLVPFLVSLLRGQGLTLVLYGREIDLSAVDPRPVGLVLLWAGFATALFPGFLQLGDRKRGPFFAMLPLSLSFCLFAYLKAGPARTVALSLTSSKSILAKVVQQPLSRVFDRDRDGFPVILCDRGCDCNDHDPRISPLAREVPGNWIDEDCDGHLADPKQSQDPPSQDPSYADLFPQEEPPPLPLEPDPGPLSSDPPTPGKNLLLITVDTLRADHLGAYGYPHRITPRIDELARQGVLFEQARAPGPATRFSIPALLTGKHFTEVHRTNAEWPRIAEDEELLAEYLERAGYFTASFHSVTYLQDHYGFGQGFSHRDHSFFRSTDNAWRTPTAEYVTDRVLSFVDKKQKKLLERPFFFWVYYGDPHFPYMAHPEFTEPGYDPQGPYDGEIVYTDHHIGRLLQGLTKRGLLADTLVVFFSDHGEGLDRKEDHGSKYHSKNLFDELIRVPLILVGKDLVPRRVKTSVSLLDLFPTILEYAEVPPQEWQDPLTQRYRGQSLWPYLQGRDVPHKPIFAEKHRAEDSIEKAMVHWPYKVMVVLPEGQFRIFDLSNDPKERDNLVWKLPQPLRDELTGALLYWTKNVLRPYGDNPRH